MIPQKYNDGMWKCEQCFSTFESKQINELVQFIDDEKNEILGNPKKKKIRIIEKTIKKWEGILDSRNLIIARLKYNLVSINF